MVIGHGRRAAVAVSRTPVHNVQPCRVGGAHLRQHDADPWRAAVSARGLNVNPQVIQQSIPGRRRSPSPDRTPDLTHGGLTPGDMNAAQVDRALLPWTQTLRDGRIAVTLVRGAVPAAAGRKEDEVGPNAWTVGCARNRNGHTGD